MTSSSKTEELSAAAAPLVEEKAEKIKLLVVDDTPENLNVLYRLLRNDYEVLGANNGPEALRVAAAAAPHLVLLDVMMPEMDGFEVCRRLKEEQSTRDIPVIFLTALGEEADESRGFALGAVDYVGKPFKPAVLLHRVAVHLEMKAQKDDLARKNAELEAALARVKELSGLLPICMTCKKIRDDQGYWNHLETYITQHSEAIFSHSFCPDCAAAELEKLMRTKGL